MSSSVSVIIQTISILLMAHHNVLIDCHKCGFDHIHNEIEKNHLHRDRKISNLTYQHFIPDLLPSSFNNNDRRHLIDSNYQPIRIVPYWDYLDEQMKDRPTDLQFIKELVSASIRYISKFVYTIPVQNNLTIDHWCQEYNQHGCREFVDYREFGLFYKYFYSSILNEPKQIQNIFENKNKKQTKT